MKAWYFATEDRKLRYGDNRPIIIGETHTVDCKPILCEQGLHGSVNIRDALSYAPGPILYLVDIEGDLDIGEDKICGKSRTYLAGFDATELLWEAARKFALVNIHLIKPYTNQYDLIVEFLTTGNEELRAAAWAAARDATGYATGAAARDAARAATGAAARAATGAAARAATGAAARDATGAAARAAARAATGAAARDAARDAARAEQSKILIELVYKYYPSIQGVKRL